MCESVYRRACASNVFYFGADFFLWVCACVFTCIGFDKLFSSTPFPFTVRQADSWAVLRPIVWGLSSNPACTTSYTARVFVYWCVGEVALLCPCTNTSTVAECDFSAFVLTSGIVLCWGFFLNICGVHDHMCIGKCLLDVFLCTNMRERR